MLKSNNLMRILLLISLILISALAWILLKGKHEDLVYVYKQSTFHSFSIDQSGYVVFDCDIVIKNHSDDEKKFTMKADVAEEMGLTKESFAYAYEDYGSNYEVFTIPPNTKQSYTVKFKALSGDKSTKNDRLPPKEIFLTQQ